MTSPTRVIVLWLPDWPVTALLRSEARAAARPVDGVAAAAADPDDAPIAIMHANRVVACSASARREGVRRGQRRRDAQGACPRLRLVPADPARDERAFSPVLTRLEQLAPGVQPLRPGLCAIRARGPARFYGGEEQAASALLDELAACGIPDARAGVADGLFTAEQAARLMSPASIRIVPRGASAAFLSPLTIAALNDDDLVALLARLGVQTLGEFAALDIAAVRDRLGDHGARLHALAGGSDSRPVVPRVPPPELAREVEFESPLELAEQVAFAVRTTADDVITGLDDAGLVCTEVRITLLDDRGGRSERVWLHPTCFDASALVDRVRWQLQATLEGESGAFGGENGGVTLVRIEPEAVDDTAHHQPALLGQGPDERLHHAMSRVQAMLGHRGVVTPLLAGGRWLGERERRVPWGDAERPAHPRDLPWPGSLPQPLPSEVYRPLRPAAVAASDGSPVAVDERGGMSAPPALLDGRQVAAWAGPWPVIERQWDPARARRAHRFQMVDTDQTAWLLVLEDERWWIEGRYT
ncbi:DNA polymerase Y family protein [Microbacterium paludicola]|uniref:DNA polymerase Y family protein n=1 Tax=Microbacterium paludicola TaxID=300019 RepID=A0A4Y9G0R1_9MICO|nr:DNA polymerase Y family protein [Microbacterium paludicola]MBF0815343.1 DNA polymerase Y family protein [Microbacterium paludicola]TFU34202.1 DNA polymerase Y family protein [Microbacterium paludicola]